ncbi:helix-turn-helix transcriptional regulator [Desulfosporosinus meridiei]|uniref:Putative transcriptional regulator n=1 Tax=Desulfosporosinus meridiei (strain ATCC BAA-275 / DSM 13257 / KCTC 12902 / NCIMB 13706 / S10) TaxID=768704 RepID=J7ITF1_DESMD|nr:helix-turn-helix transcriptional regulator [Desulfosporosinus meridiei]AFQ45162.1 putative transcriptional regulator [Desulfosporosinus meridiei DSM 13257]
MGVGERIKQFRKQKGLTQVKLAEKAGISRSYLADVESDRYNPSLTTLIDLAQALNVTASCFLDDKEIDFSNLIQLCKKNGMSLSSLGAILDISPKELDHIRSNKLPVEETMSKIADHFECTWDYLIGKTDSPDDIVLGGNSISIQDPISTPPQKVGSSVEPINIPSTIAAHFENMNFTKEETEEISNFIKFIASKRKK